MREGMERRFPRGEAPKGGLRRRAGRTHSFSFYEGKTTNGVLRPAAGERRDHKRKEV